MKKVFSIIWFLFECCCDKYKLLLIDKNFCCLLRKCEFLLVMLILVFMVVGILFYVVFYFGYQIDFFDVLQCIMVFFVFVMMVIGDISVRIDIVV